MIQSKPYIGVTGHFEGVHQTKLLAQYAQILGIGPEHSHVLMQGALVSNGTLSGERYKNSFRHVANLTELGTFVRVCVENGVLAMAHFEISGEGKGINNKSQPFADNLSQLLNGSNGLYEKGLKAIQLNGNPDPKEIAKLVANFDQLKLVYQARRELLTLGAGHAGKIIGEAIEASKGQIAYVLLDPSAGTEERFDAGNLTSFSSHFSSVLPGHIVYGFAGGLNPKNVENRVLEVARAFAGNHFSVDVETGVRTDNSHSPNSQMDFERARAYLSAAARGLGLST